MLEVGTKAPAFTLPDQNGNMHSLEDYRGRKLILYFYPKDNTSGCTKQACGFSERYPQFTEKGVEVLGVSKDSVESHKKFEEKYGLAFTLLADPERKVLEAYDVWKEKKNYGKVSMGVVRTTYLIDENGVIIRANDKVKAAEDPEKTYDMGADSFKVFMTVTLPLIKDSFLSGFVTSFVRSITAISAIILLVTPSYLLITVQINEFAEKGSYGIACAFASILILITYSSVLIMNILMKYFGTSRKVQIKD